MTFVILRRINLYQEVMERLLFISDCFVVPICNLQSLIFEKLKILARIRIFQRKYLQKLKKRLQSHYRENRRKATVGFKKNGN
jgi:hypothetical protein